MVHLCHRLCTRENSRTYHDAYVRLFRIGLAYGVGISADTWDEYALSVPPEPTDVTT